MDTKLSPYLALDGNAREAMEFYKDVFGGTLEIQTFAEAGREMPGAEPDRVMHARLDAGDIMFMASDSMPGQPSTVGTNVSLSLTGSDVDALTAIFGRLSEGGQVMMPLEQQFWGDTFGMLTDRYGLQWMVNISAG